MSNTKEDLSLEDYAKYYLATVWCWNCSKRNDLYIKKGIPAHNINKKCSNCGCDINMRTGKKR